MEKRLRPLLEKMPQRPILSHVLDFYGQGTTDDVWISQIKNDGWIVISADRAKQCGGPKLPDLCMKFAVSHVFISGKLHTSGNVYKAAALIAVWNQLAELPNKPKGTRMLLQFDNANKYKLVHRVPSFKEAFLSNY